MGKPCALVAKLRQQVANIFAVPVEIFTTARMIKNARPGAYIHFQRSPLSGRALDHYAWEWIGINRQPGETDEELRRRCIDTLNREYKGTLVVPQDDLRELLEAENSKKQGVKRNE